jgi:hypothetical protein
MSPQRIVAPLMAVLALLSASAPAHDAMALDSMPSAHGGQVRMAGPYHMELVLEGTPTGETRSIHIFLQNHLFADVASAGITGMVRLTEGSQTTAISLTPDGFNSLRGQGRYASRSMVRAVVVLTTKDGEQWSATFAPASTVPVAALN